MGCALPTCSTTVKQHFIHLLQSRRRRRRFRQALQQQQTQQTPSQPAALTLVVLPPAALSGPMMWPLQPQRRLQLPSAVRPQRPPVLPEGPHPDQARQAAPHQAAAAAGGGGGGGGGGGCGGGSGGSSYASATAAQAPDGTSSGVGGGGCAAGGGGSSAYESAVPHLHPHPHSQASIRAAHRRIRIQICSYFPSIFTAARNIKAHQEYQSRSFSKSTRSYPGDSRLRILNRMLYAGTIDFCTVIGPVGQIRATTFGFSDVLHYKLDIRHFFLFYQNAVNLEPCSQQLHDYW